jgi:addiction module HigA family antidote
MTGGRYAMPRGDVAWPQDVPPTRLHAIVHETRGITADTAVRLARHFGGDAASSLALQAEYDLKTLPTRQEIERRVKPREAA